MHSTQQSKSVLARVAFITAMAAAVVSFSPATSADGVGAFLGGMLASSVLHNMRERTEAEQVQAAAAERQAAAAQYHAPPRAPASSTASIEERLRTLDQLAAKGYISKEEYNKRKQEILNSI